MNSGESNNSGASPGIIEFRTEIEENKEIENESGVRKGHVQDPIKRRGCAETTNTCERNENLVSWSDDIEAFKEGSRSGKYNGRLRKRPEAAYVKQFTQAKKRTQGTPGSSTSSLPTAKRVKFVCDVNHENGGKSGIGGTGGNDDAVAQGDGNGSGSVSPQVEEKKDQYDLDVNLNESTRIQLTSGGTSSLATSILQSRNCFKNRHKKVNGEKLVQANGRLWKRRKAAYLKQFIQDTTLQNPRVTNNAAIDQGNGNGTVLVDIPPQVTEGRRDNHGMGVNPGEYAGTELRNGGSSMEAVDILEPTTLEAIFFANGHQKVDRAGLDQGNGCLGNRCKATTGKRFNQEQAPCVAKYAAQDLTTENTSAEVTSPQNPLVTNNAAIDQANGNGTVSVDIPPQVKEGRRDNHDMGVNPGEYAGTELRNGGSSRETVDIQEPRTSEAIFFENGHQKVDRAGLDQGNRRSRNRRKPATVKRFNQEQAPCVAIYAARDLTTENTSAGGTAGQNLNKTSVHKSKSDNNTETFSITEIIKPINFSSSGSVPDVQVTFLAKRSDGKEVMVDNKYLKANHPLLLINYYECYATAGRESSGTEYMAG